MGTGVKNSPHSKRNDCITGTTSLGNGLTSVIVQNNAEQQHQRVPQIDKNQLTKMSDQQIKEIRNTAVLI